VIYSYRPIKNREARKKYLVSFAAMYLISAAISIWKIAGSQKYVYTALALFFAITALMFTTLRRPRFFAVRDGWLYCGRKIDVREAEILPDFEKLVVKVRWKGEKTLYFESEDEMRKFLEEVEKVKYS